METQINQTVNGYTLLHKIGEGGMAEVWYAENEINKPAAIKILKKEFILNDDISTRFKNEAKIMVKLNHPNIRQVYGYGSLNSTPCIIMEYLEGSDLSQLLKKGAKFNDEQLKSWWDLIASALKYTHENEIVHRDIKPSNIFLTNNGEIKLLDFGIAKIRDSITITRTGAHMGTLMYMSPEQIKDSKHIDFKTDLYSLAVCFFHLLTSRTPYDLTKSSDFEIRENIVYKPLPLEQIPSNWKEKLGPLLEKDPIKRKELAFFYQNQIPYLKPNPEKQKILKKNKISPRLIIIAASIFLAGGMFSFFLFTSKGDFDLDEIAKLSESINQASKNIDSNTQTIYLAIETNVVENPTKYTPLLNKAREIEKCAKSLYAEIDKTIAAIIMEADGSDSNTLSGLKELDDKDASNKVFKSNATEKTLNDGISNFSAAVLSISDIQNSSIINDLTSKEYTNDYFDQFYNHPAIVSIYLLSKLKLDIKNDEYLALKFLTSSMEGNDIKFTGFEVLISSPNKYIISGTGQKYTSKIFLGAFDTTLAPKIHLTKTKPFYDSIINSDGSIEYKLSDQVNYSQIESSNGYGIFEEGADVIGTTNYGGLVEYTSNRGGSKFYPFRDSYTVAHSSITTIASKANVLYRGLENPITVIAPGIASENINVSSSGGVTIKRTSNGFIAYVPASTTASEVSISITSGGKNLGTSKFKVLNVPPPTIFIAGAYKDGSTVPKAAITRSPTLIAKLESDFFPFEGISYSIVSYEFLYQVRGVTQTITASGSSIPGNVMTELNRMGPGSAASFTNIKVSGPSGVRQTNGVTVKLQ